MKLLMIYAEKIGYKTTSKTIESMPDTDEEKVYENVLVGFIQAEKEDEKDFKYVENKLVKNLKWAAGKNNTNRILLHSFAHLSVSKSSIDFAKKLLDNAEERIGKSSYEAYQTPFGYFLDLDIQAPGKSLARIFKDIGVK